MAEQGTLNVGEAVQTRPPGPGAPGPGASGPRKELPASPAPYLSFSRLSLYAGCPRRYKLRYVDKAPGRPNGAGIGGRAVHEVIVEAEQDVAWADEDVWEDPGPWAERFRARFTELVDEVGAAACYWGGRRSKRWPEGEDFAWWAEHGPRFLWRYARLRRAAVEAGLVIPGGEVELEVGVDLDGTYVKGYVDAVPLVDEATGEVRIRDYKTGTMLDALQLVIYGWLVQEAKGWTVKVGEFAKLRAEDEADRILTFDLGQWMGVAPERMRALAAQLEVSHERDLWPVNPSNLCVACDVKEHCPWGRHVERRS